MPCWEELTFGVDVVDVVFFVNLIAHTSSGSGVSSNKGTYTTPDLGACTSANSAANSTTNVQSNRTPNHSPHIATYAAPHCGAYWNADHAANPSTITASHYRANRRVRPGAEF